MNMKKWLKIILVIFFLISVAWILSIYLRGVSPKKSLLTPSKPNLVQTYKGNLPISLKTTEGQFKYVDKLPFLNISKKNITEDYINKVASFMGFASTSIKIDDSQEGLTYFWKNDNATFFAYTKSSKIHFSSGKSYVVPNKQLSENAVKATVEKFLIDSGILSTDSFSLSNVQFLKEISLNEGFQKSTKEDFSLYQVNILPKTTAYEIISPSSTESVGYVQLTKDGNIYLFQLILFDNIEKGLTEYKIKNYSVINTSITNSVLISLGGEETPLKDLSRDLIKEIVVDQIDIAYLIDSPISTTLQPIYKLTGMATLSNGNKTEAILYLPALSGL